jgi:hypothetical protein
MYLIATANGAPQAVIFISVMARWAHRIAILSGNGAR